MKPALWKTKNRGKLIIPMKATVNDPVWELKAVLAEHLPWHGARIDFLARFLLA